MNHWDLDENAYQEYLKGTLECRKAYPLFAEHHRRVTAAEAAGRSRPSVLSPLATLLREGRDLGDQNAVPEAARQRKQSRAAGKTAQTGVEYYAQKHTES